MGLREAVMRALRSGDDATVRDLATTDRRAMRHFFGRLWDPDASVRRRAAVGVGWAAVAHPDQGRTVLRKVLWALNDESATNGVYAIPALPAIAQRAPELARPFVHPMASYAWDEGLRPAIEEALGAMESVLPDEVADCRRRIYHGAADATSKASSSPGRKTARKGDQREG
jgi:hypothetical protein